jgi:hypothetical protein
MRAGESTFMGCPLSYLHRRPSLSRLASLGNYIAEGVRGGGKETNSWWRSAAALARSTPMFFNDTASECGCEGWDSNSRPPA